MAEIRLFEAARKVVLLLSNNDMVNLIAACQLRRKILQTIGSVFMLILGGLWGPSGAPKNCIQP